MRDLLAGVTRFQQRKYPELRSRFEQLANGQQPDALFITCSDSRVDPVLLTDCLPGELFVIRNAGNIVGRQGEADLGIAATIEYAVKALQVPQIIICGHSQCGAMAGLLDPASASSLPDVSKWVASAKGALEATPQDEDVDRLTQVIRANIRLQLRNLMTFTAVAEAVEAGRLVLKGWLYDFENGTVDVLSPETDQFDTVTTGTV
ncbi:carbonic anhydrase [Blastopirellula marina]|uniref:Carbonic anhydrase n=1 Tax=Blastopirellula marina TaxID=124 RepID=A0A2S8G0L8_9BACT|nr:carbonic anhydrase [Blastopirellula marina]PQO37992.1 carbonic anhydrase [Blastopirellula marina]PTL44648.1 carbonic anhydrase [Blastopirellula marina]